MIKYLFLSVMIFACLPVFAQDNESCRSKRSSEIVKIFDKGMALNENIKKSAGGAGNDNYQRLRKEVEQYDEETVMPCVRRAAQLMTEHADSVLMHKLMELVISHENSADETISYAMAKLFASNPAAVERTLKEFPCHGRRIIADTVQAGWINVKPELSSSIVKNRDGRLKKMLCSVGNLAGAGAIRNEQ